ncbi:MAG: S8 family peptidase [Eubacteriales bacterium]|nr:S8 family peptidase [Eubacteriales bacterium]
MDNVSLRDRILSEDYADIIAILDLQQPSVQREFARFGAQSLGSQFAMYHVPLRELPANLLNYLGYYNIPKLYTTLDTTSLERSGILQLQTLPSFQLTGKNVLVGFLDTGINYQSAAFRHPNGTTRILEIWDQTIQSDHPSSFQYGTVYRREQIDEALSSEDPLSVVPTVDTDGHGTFLASVACGSPDPANQFTGASPDCQIAAVKLKPAKKYLHSFFQVPQDALAFQETDIMAGITYLQQLASENGLPLVICFGIGTNQGDHAGGSPLAGMISEYARKTGFYPIIAAGNEAGKSHHFYGKLEEQGGSLPVEILCSPDTEGFSVELWAQPPELYSVSITSPLGETIPNIPPRMRQQSTFTFALERTVLYVNYELVESQSGSQLIILRFQNPTSGVWQIRVTNNIFINGAFHLWLPITGFIPEGTVFLAPNPDTTLTSPSDASGGITISTYNAYDNSLYINSSRGYTRKGGIKPDIAAPGVDVTGVSLAYGDSSASNFRYSTATGSSVAAAITAGAAAILVDWEMNRPLPFVPTAAEIQNLLIRGARRSTDQLYPNRAWGYGTLDLYGIFQSLI